MLNNCDYKPVYSSQNKIDYKIVIASFSGDKDINNLIATNIKRNSKEESGKIVEIVFNTEYTKNVLAKNSAGSITDFQTDVQTTFTIKNGNSSVKPQLPSGNHEKEKRKRNVQSRTIETKRKIIAAAEAEFAQMGFNGASVRTIAKRADLQHTLITYHFGNKEGLWQATVSRMLSEYTKQQESRLVTRLAVGRRRSR